MASQHLAAVQEQPNAGAGIRRAPSGAMLVPRPAPQQQQQLPLLGTSNGRLVATARRQQEVRAAETAAAVAAYRLLDPATRLYAQHAQQSPVVQRSPRLASAMPQQSQAALSHAAVHDLAMEDMRQHRLLQIIRPQASATAGTHVCTRTSWLPDAAAESLG